MPINCFKRISYIINTIIKTTSVTVTVTQGLRSVGGGRGWLAGDTTGWQAGRLAGDGGRGQPVRSRR